MTKLSKKETEKGVSIWGTLIPKSVSQWSQSLGILRSTAKNRVRKGVKNKQIDLGLAVTPQVLAMEFNPTLVELTKPTLLNPLSHVGKSKKKAPYLGTKALIKYWSS
jgi:hypothetical protein